jgi:hypothetical protein
MECPSTRWAQVGPWIDGLTFECDSEFCTDTTNDGNATEDAFAVAYGPHQAHAIHRFSDDDKQTWTSLPNSNEMLLAGDPPPGECTECEFNPEPTTPIIISLGRGTKYKLTSAADGVLFDFNCDGVAERISWTQPNSDVAFLALDVNGDGMITSGRELFGNYTLPGAANGFLALQRLAMQTNGGVVRASVSSEDPLFARLLLWSDANHNGISESWELRPASEQVSDIGLGYQPMKRRDGYGNLFHFRGWAHVRTADGRNRVNSPEENVERTRKIWDVYLVTER